MPPRRTGMHNYQCRSEIYEAMVISALRHKSKYNLKFNFELFLEKKKNQISGFLCCTTREDLSINVSFTNAELILTKLK